MCFLLNKYSMMLNEKKGGTKCTQLWDMSKKKGICHSCNK